MASTAVVNTSFNPTDTGSIIDLVETGDFAITEQVVTVGFSLIINRTRLKKLSICHLRKNSTSQEPNSVEIVASSSKLPNIVNSAAKVTNETSIVPTKTGTFGAGAGYQYEIDCKRVADSIDVKDLVCDFSFQIYACCTY